LLPPDAKLKMHQNAFGGRAPPGPAGELKCSPDPLAAKRGLLLRGKDGRERGKGGERRGAERKERGKEGALLISGQRGLFP